MSTQVQFRRGTSTETINFTGALGEVTVDTTKNTCVVHDASRPGGYALLREDGSNSSLVLGSATSCSLKFINDPGTGFYSPGVNQCAIATAGVQRLVVDATGNISISGSLSAGTITFTSGIFALGTAAAPSITFTGNTNTGIYSPGAGLVAVTTGGNERIRIDGAGQVGFGTSTPLALVHLSSTLTGTSANSNVIATIRSQVAGRDANIQIGDGTNFGYIGVLSGNLYFSTASSERARIDSSGRVLIGVSSFTGGATQVLQGQSAGATLNAVLWLNKGATATSGDTLGTVKFADNSGNTYAQIDVVADAATGANDYPGRFVFSTTADGASSPTERLRISNAGRISVANSSLGTVSALGSVSGTVTLDLITANNFSLTLPAGGTVTLANPSNQTAGQSGSIVITQNGTTAATVAYGSNWKFSGGTPTMSTGLGSVSVLVYYVESSSRITARLLTDVQ